MLATAELPRNPQVQAVIDGYYVKEEERLLASRVSSDRRRAEAHLGGQARESARVRDEGTAVWQAAEVGYVPAWGCARCHPGEVKVWQASAHARALDTLVRGKRLVAECAPCHSEQFRRSAQAPAQPAAAPVPGEGRRPPMEGGVECASCHGDGVLHTAVGTAGTTKRGSPDACVTCHQAERSPQFETGEYWARIRH